ncbi:hypothetical protein BMS3Bbin10_02085 [bacterium BMS3Bbin10]|nr:hypothetical protein BMS3Bbin10_02085 [bacterium BMS3Bbin10]
MNVAVPVKGGYQQFSGNARKRLGSGGHIHYRSFRGLTLWRETAFFGVGMG